MTIPHGLPAGWFGALATGYGEGATVTALRQAQRSKRMIQLRAILDAVTARPDADAAALAEGFALLRAAAEADPAAADRALLDPHFGVWAADCLRPPSGGAVRAPPGSGLAYLSSFAAVAAWRAGLDFAVPVPVRGGFVTLSGLGQLRTNRPDGEAVIAAARDGLLRVDSVTIDEPERDGAGWHALRRLCLTVGGRRLQVALDDVDPYRGCHTAGPAHRLTDAEAEVWRRCVSEVWHRLVDVHPRYADGISAALVAIVPLTGAGQKQGASATSRDAFGAVSVRLPSDGLMLAEALVHEVQHVKLGGLLDLLPLYDGADTTTYYAPWREDPRPIGGLFQGAYAFLGVADFWRGERLVRTGDSALAAEIRFCRWRHRVSLALDTLLDSGRFGADGLRFLAYMRTTVESWRDERVSRRARRAAVEASARHRATWLSLHGTPSGV